MTSSYRSQREADLAGMFERYGIACRYEHPLAVMDRNRLQIYYPDFWLPEQAAVIEYCGLNGRPAYDARTRHKKSVYADMGLAALFLEDKDFKGYWPRKLLAWLERVQERRLERIRTIRKR